MLISDQKNIIAVNATAIKSGGAYTILRQFLSHIPDEHLYYIFINETLDINLVLSPNIQLIRVNINNALKRIAWDCYGLKKWFSSRNILPTTVVSLQNTSIATHKKSKHIIYLHQGLPLHDKKWSFLKKKERPLAFYKYIYPLFIFLFANKKTKFIVQTQWMKNALCTKYKQDKQQVYVIKPELTAINPDEIEPIALPYKYTLFYPATSQLFKNHHELIWALDALRNKVDLSLVALFLTIDAHEDKELLALIRTLKLEKNVHFLGQISYDEVLSYYKSCTVVVFPSYIESFGMPLLEGALFGKPVVVLDTDYSREVLKNYKGAFFAQQNSPQSWQFAILEAFLLPQKLNIFKPVSDSELNWDDFFKLIHERGDA